MINKNYILKFIKYGAPIILKKGGDHGMVNIFYDNAHRVRNLFGLPCLNKF